MDDVDLAILRELQEDGHLSLVELGRRVGLSAAPVQRRVRSLEREGWIERYVAFVDRRLAHRSFEVFLEVALETESRDALQAFEEGVHALPEIMECHRVTGTPQYLLKVVTKDASSFDLFYSDYLLSLPGVRRTTRQVSLSRIKYTTALPLPRVVRHL
jgi:Lrp/AsnC family transcriptional regulator, leucine-responsive regulatory protein